MNKRKRRRRDYSWVTLVIFALLFALPIVLTISNSFMSADEIDRSYAAAIGSSTDAYINEQVVLKFIPDMVSLDCTYGPISAYGGDRDGHMGIPQNRKVKDRLIADGVCSDQTIFVINHFSHNGNALYDELCEEVRKDGFLVAFDGRIVEF